MSTNILRPIAEIQVSAWPEFDTRERCVAGYDGKGPNDLKVTWFQPDFYERYLGIAMVRPEGGGKLQKQLLDQWLVEKSVPAKTIVVNELVVGARDPRIIAELDPNGTGAHVISLAHYFELLNRHPNGEYVKGSEGGIRVNHYENIAYCLDREGLLRSVSGDWFKPGWSIATDPIDQLDENEADAADRIGSWRAGDYVLSYKH